MLLDICPSCVAGVAASLCRTAYQLAAPHMAGLLVSGAAAGAREVLDGEGWAPQVYVHACMHVCCPHCNHAASCGAACTRVLVVSAIMHLLPSLHERETSALLPLCHAGHEHHLIMGMQPLMACVVAAPVFAMALHTLISAVACWLFAIIVANSNKRFAKLRSSDKWLKAKQVGAGARAYTSSRWSFWGFLGSGGGAVPDCLVQLCPWSTTGAQTMGAHTTSALSYRRLSRSSSACADGTRRRPSCSRRSQRRRTHRGSCASSSTAVGTLRGREPARRLQTLRRLEPHGRAPRSRRWSIGAHASNTCVRGLGRRGWVLCMFDTKACACACAPTHVQVPCDWCAQEPCSDPGSALTRA